MDAVGECLARQAERCRDMLREHPDGGCIERIAFLSCVVYDLRVVYGLCSHDVVPNTPCIRGSIGYLGRETGIKGTICTVDCSCVCACACVSMRCVCSTYMCVCAGCVGVWVCASV